MLPPTSIPVLSSLLLLSSSYSAFAFATPTHGRNIHDTAGRSSLLSSALSSWPLKSLWTRKNSGPPPAVVPPAGYYPPADKSGSLLTLVNGTGGMGEPLNLIIRGDSSPEVLIDQEINGGLRNYYLSFGFSSECLGQHAGAPQSADLGDGLGRKNESAVLRWNYGDPSFGACRESIEGGNHFREWSQNGPQANSGAIFCAVSSEYPISRAHDIIPNGYNLGRDYLIGNITHSTIDTRSLVSNQTFSGTTSYAGYTYQTEIQYTSGLLKNSSEGVNHASDVELDGFPAIDGLVAVLKVTISDRPKSAATSWRLNRRLVTVLPWDATSIWVLASALTTIAVSFLC